MKWISERLVIHVQATLGRNVTISPLGEISSHLGHEKGQESSLDPWGVSTFPWESTLEGFLQWKEKVGD